MPDADRGPELVVCSWRIQTADPSGMTMWFDPDREVPRLESLSSDQRRDRDEFYEGGALEGTSMEEEGVPLGGSETRMSDRRQIWLFSDPAGELPF